ncbi:MAG: AAA family ATPase [Methanobrevibacter boviskoreani]|uniref:AAA family ATPase n=1 Tax=Methanobrevibacter boviskoreani TaxID=1348249 RepID=UPI0023A7982E|nr:AAA family ATPase [Methanobrevibacter boviskoreani]MCI6929860.1 AAA family ATPase [Methanobrevibacter boviskoreani]MDD6256628.1 AAA family ATPase [Methanobrevibacter boviskoreani]MDY5614266.1 AAA family ATPase [Methanobrevibacter boviskoreani]
MNVIGISGLPGSGKSYISKFAIDKGAIVVNMGDCVREEAKKRNEDSRVTAIKLREEFGKYVVANLTINKIKGLLNENVNSKLIVVEGIRSPYEVELFKNNFEDFKILSVFSSPKTRFNRLKLRNRADDSQNFEDFKKRDLDELSFGIGDVISTSDYLIINEDDLDSYKKEVNRYLNLFLS